MKPLALSVSLPLLNSYPTLHLNALISAAPYPHVIQELFNAHWFGPLYSTSVCI